MFTEHKEGAPSAATEPLADMRGEPDASSR
jgi:hypothetical protein